MKEGVRSSWKGHRPFREPIPAGRSATCSPMISSIFTALRTASISSLRIRPAMASVYRGPPARVVRLCLELLGQHPAPARVPGRGRDVGERSNLVDDRAQAHAIIGGGPAGLSCAFYLAEKGYRPVVFEKNEKPGGMLVYGIPSFKLEKDVVDAEIEIIRQMGVEIRCGIEV